MEIQEVEVTSTPSALKSAADSYKLICVTIHIVTSSEYLRKHEKAKVENFLVEIVVCPQAGMLSARIEKD